jgi:hypothetical protein
MDFQKTTTFIPKFVWEVVDFKSYVKNFYHDGTNKLIGLEEMQMFKFFFLKMEKTNGDLSCAIRCLCQLCSSILFYWIWINILVPPLCQPTANMIPGIKSFLCVHE